MTDIDRANKLTCNIVKKCSGFMRNNRSKNKNSHKEKVCGVFSLIRNERN